MNRCIKLILGAMFLLSLFSCKPGDCGKNFYISGKVVDQNDLPMSDVEVYEVTHFGFVGKPAASTNASGDFSYFLGKYSDLGNGYIFFRKTGYPDLSTSPVLGKGDGTCNDQQIIRNGKMSP